MRFTTKIRDLSRNIQRKKVNINENKLKSWLRFVGISTYVLYERTEKIVFLARTHSYVQKFKIVEHFIFASDLIRYAVCTDTQFYLFYVTLRQHYAFIAIARVNYISHICLYRAQNVVLFLSSSISIYRLPSLLQITNVQVDLKITLVFHNTWKTAMPIEQMKMNLIQKKEHKQQQFSEQADIVYFT